MTTDAFTEQIDPDKLRAEMEALDPDDLEAVYIFPHQVLALLDQIDQAEAERDEWRQTAQEERAAALDLIEVVKERDQRIKTLGWRNGHLIDKYCADMADLRQESDEETQALVSRADQAEARIQAVRDVLDAGDKDERWWVQEWGHRAVMTADIRRALDGDTL